MNLLFSCILIFACSVTKLRAQLLKKDSALHKSAEIDVDGADPGKWKLVFSDMFNSKGTFDESKWGYCTRQSPAWARFLTSSNGYVHQKGGNLVLRMDKAVIAGDSVPYHSGGIQTSGKFSIRMVKLKFEQSSKKGRAPGLQSG